MSTVVVTTPGPQGPKGPKGDTGATGPAGPPGTSSTVANDIAKQGGVDINRVQGLNRVPFVDVVGAAVADGVKPPRGGGWISSHAGGVDGFRAKKGVMPGHFDVEDYGALPFDGLTADTTNGSAVIVVSDKSRLAVGQQLKIRGISGIKTIQSIDPVLNQVTLTSTCDASATGAIVFIDNLAAFQAALAAMDRYYLVTTPNSHQKCKLIAHGAFFLSNTLEFVHACIIEGSGSSYAFDLSGLVSPTSGTYPGTYLIWPFGTTGMRFYSQIGGVGDAAQSVLRNLTLTTIGWTQDGFSHTTPSTGYGVYTHTIINMYNCHVNRFGSHGVYVLANNSDPPPLAGNASGCYFERVYSGDNGGDGFRFDGGDANICAVVGCDASANTGWGFNDNSGLGNSFFGCHCEGNIGIPDTGAYNPAVNSPDGLNHDYRNAPSALNRACFVGCYSEASLNALYHPGIVLGGNLCSTGLLPGSTITKFDGNLIENGHITHRNTQGSVPIESSLGQLGTALIFNQWATDSGALATLSWNTTHNAFAFRINGSGYQEAIRIPSNLSYWGRFSPWFATGMYLGDDDTLSSRLHMLAADAPPSYTGAGAPSAATYEVGDRVIRQTVSAGSVEGQTCTVAGTKGTLMGGTVTATTTNGSPTVTVSDYPDLMIGRYITIAGVTGKKKVINHAGYVLTLDSNCDATVSGAAVAYSAPVFEDFGRVGYEQVVTYGANHTLSASELHVSFTTASTATLPASPKNGQTHTIYALHASGLTVSGNGVDIGWPARGTSETLLQGETRTYRYDSANACWLRS